MLTIKITKMKRKKGRRRRMSWMKIRRRMRMRMMAKNLGRLARDRWYLYWLTTYIPWQTISHPFYLSKGRRCTSIPQSHNLRRLPHVHTPLNLAHDYPLWRLIT